MAKEPRSPRRNRTRSLNRRAYLGSVGGALSVALAGCLGDGSQQEVNDSLEATVGHLEDAGEGFDEFGPHIDNEEYDQCLATADPVREDLSAAEKNASEAQSVAEENGHSDLADVAVDALELIDVLNRMVDTVEKLCTAGSEGDREAFNNHLGTLEELEQQRVQRQEEFRQSMETPDG